MSFFHGRFVFLKAGARIKSSQVWEGGGGGCHTESVAFLASSSLKRSQFRKNTSCDKEAGGVADTRIEIGQSGDDPLAAT